MCLSFLVLCSPANLNKDQLDYLNGFVYFLQQILVVDHKKTLLKCLPSSQVSSPNFKFFQTKNFQPRTLTKKILIFLYFTGKPVIIANKNCTILTVFRLKSLKIKQRKLRPTKKYIQISFTFLKLRIRLRYKKQVIHSKKTTLEK